MRGLTATWLTQGLDETSMGKASRTKVESSRREKIAAQRAAERRAAQRRRILIASGSILAVIVVVVAFIVINANKKPTATASNGTASAAVVSALTGVPASVLDKVGTGSGKYTGKIQAVSGGSALTSGGKPEMLYMGAEYCPYCAAARWAMIVALSRFGTFSGLATIRSAVANGAGNAEPDPNTPTWTFAHATYTSKYLTFTPVEMQTNIPDKTSGTYTILQNPTKAQQAVLTKYDAPPYVASAQAGAIPFIDFGNKYLSIGTPYDPGVLAGLSWSKIATDLSNPNSPVAQAIDGTANYFTAAICKLTNNQPASACTATVKSLEGSL